MIILVTQVINSAPSGHPRPLLTAAGALDEPLEEAAAAADADDPRHVQPAQLRVHEREEVPGRPDPAQQRVEKRLVRVHVHDGLPLIWKTAYGRISGNAKEQKYRGVFCGNLFLLSSR